MLQARLRQHYFGIYAFNPMVRGLPCTVSDVFMLPRVLAATRVLPEALGVGSSMSHMMTSLFPSIFVSIAMLFSSAYRRPLFGWYSVCAALLGAHQIPFFMPRGPGGSPRACHRLAGSPTAIPDTAQCPLPGRASGDSEGSSHCNCPAQASWVLPPSV